jgi:hypothetical protein
MTSLLNTKNLLLGVCAAAAFSAAYWFNKPADLDVAVVQPSSRSAAASKPSRTASGASAQPQSTLRPLERGVISSSNDKDVFSQHSWVPAPPPAPPSPPPAPPPPPVKPMAPPLPFSFVGLLDEKGAARRVFLSKSDHLIIVKANDVVEGQYRVDQITENSVDLTYLPLNQKQSISIQQAGL